MKSNVFKTLFFTAVTVFLTSCSLVKPRSGDESLSFLSGQNDINVVFDYSDVSVGKYAEIDFVMKYVLTNDLENSKATFDVYDVLDETTKVDVSGMIGGFDFTAAQRLVGAYEKGGKEMGLHLRAKFLKHIIAVYPKTITL